MVLMGCGSAGGADGGSTADAGSLWPVGATQLFVSSSVGYFSCVREDWTLNFAGRLEFTTSTLVSASDPYGACTTATGSRALNQADLDRLDVAMKALTQPSGAQCNVSDGPQLSAQVTTATGSTLYREAGEGCSTTDPSITVSGLDPVLHVLRAWAL
jgi:hypothetical protein